MNYLIAIFVALILIGLQSYLGHKTSKVIGLILPLTCFALSVYLTYKNNGSYFRPFIVLVALYGAFESSYKNKVKTEIAKMKAMDNLD